MIRLLLALLTTVVFADDGFKSARHLGVLQQSLLVSDSVDRGDINDYFQFRVTHRQRVRVTLNHLFENANLGLYDSQRRVLKTSLNPGAQSEELSGVLNPGLYFVRVASWRSNQGRWSETTYDLRIRSRSTGPKDFGGNTLAQATQIGHTYLQQGRPYSLLEWIGHSGDNVDFYEFRVSGPQHYQRFAAQLNLPNTARLELYYFTGNYNQPWRLHEVSQPIGRFLQELRVTLEPNRYIIGVMDRGRHPVQYRLEMYTLRYKNQYPPF